MGIVFKSPKQKAIKHLDGIERGIDLMRESLYKEEIDRKGFGKGFLQFYKSHRRLTRIAKVSRMVDEAKKFFGSERVAKVILKELADFEDIRGSLRGLLDTEMMPPEVLKKIFDEIETYWCERRSSNRASGKNLLAVYRECVLRWKE